MITDGDSDDATEVEVAEIVRNVDFLEHLTDELTGNAHAVKFRVFKRGELVERDSNQSEWIYFIKSGSVSVLKKLKAVPPKRLSKSEDLDQFKRVKQFRNVNHADFVDELFSANHIPIYNSPYEMEKRLEQTLPGYLNHADRLGVVPYDDIIEKQKQRVRRETFIDVPSLPAIQINDSDACPPDLPTDRKTPPVMKSSLCLPPIRKGSNGSFFFQTLFAKQKPGEVPREKKRLDVYQTQEQIPDFTQRGKPRKSIAKTRIKAAQISRLGNVTGDNSIFLSVQVLEKGEYFGFNNLLHHDQPSLSLVSNGAECVLISKKFFQQHLDGALLSKLRDTENRYPKSATLQEKVQDLVNWIEGRKKIYSQLVLDKRKKIECRKQFHPQYLGEYCFRFGPG
ncbi:uncharacterized protein LOC135461880 [Liolophura sinensis]|uniref:uncharacterized protein LOC135461880 n=1 Tax=Liolophura sinensis TaxID=3198878 RepID=UPI0031596F0F